MGSTTDSMPLVSVVLTTYNASAHVEDCLKCLLSQTFQQFEIIVVDDASTDCTCEIIDQNLAGRIPHRLLRLKRNTGGPAEPRNMGVQEAKGHWVALLDSDDLWHPQKLEIELQVARQSGSPFVSSEKLWFRSVKETDARRNQLFSLKGHQTRLVTHKQLCRKNFLCTSSVLAERTLFIRHPCNTNPDYRAVEDYRCWLDIHRESVTSSPQILTPLVYYRIWPGSISGSKLGMIRKHLRLYRDYFRGQPLSGIQVLLSFTVYGFASLYRQLKYRRSRC